MNKQKIQIALLVAALVCGIGSLWISLDTRASGIIVQGIQPIHFSNPVFFDRNAQFNGDVTATVLHASGVLGNVTPVATATSIAGGLGFTGPVTATKITAATMVANQFVQAGTPVVAFSTPSFKQTAQAVGCVMWSGTITGTTTIVDHGWSTVVGADPWLAQAATGDAAGVYSSVTGITVTLGVVNSALTPVANSTGAAVKALICGY
jgi:hypothetical protein